MSLLREAGFTREESIDFLAGRSDAEYSGLRLEIISKDCSYENVGYAFAGTYAAFEPSVLRSRSRFLSPSAYESWFFQSLKSGM